ncbi:unnamed protein product [Closterium sp. NIES-54]
MVSKEVRSSFTAALLTCHCHCCAAAAALPRTRCPALSCAAPCALLCACRPALPRALPHCRPCHHPCCPAALLLAQRFHAAVYAAILPPALQPDLRNYFPRRHLRCSPRTANCCPLLARCCPCAAPCSCSLTHLRSLDTRYCAALPPEFLAENQLPMYLTLYFLMTRLPDTLHVVRDHFFSLDPTSSTLASFDTRLLESETTTRAVTASHGTPSTSFFERCAPSLFASSVASAAAVDVLISFRSNGPKFP